MRIGIDISQVVYAGTGVARFTRGFINAICTYETSHQWFFYAFSLRSRLSDDIERQIKNRGFYLHKAPYPSRYLAWIWNTHHRSRLAKTLATTTMSRDLDWFITSDWTEPPMQVKKATIVHDLVFHRFPETTTPLIRKTQQQRLKIVAQESSIIFTDSQATEQDIVNYYPSTLGKIVVNYPGVSITPVDRRQIPNILSTFTLKKPFLLSIGKMEPRKNLHRLIAAYTRLKRSDFELVIAGPPGWDAVKPVPGVRLLGFVSDEQLAALYQSAKGFIYPSLWEGFGYPPIEAMRLGCPVAVSNTSALAEIGSHGALLFDPTDVSAIANSMSKILDDSALRVELQEKGEKQSQTYTWERYFTTVITALSQYT